MNQSRAAAHEWLGTRSTASAANKATSAITTKLFIDRGIPTSSFPPAAPSARRS